MLYDAQLVAQAAGLKKAYAHEMDTFAPHNALSETFKLIQRANKYIDENAPWALAKDMEANGARLAHVLYNLLEATRICGILLTPFMPESMEKLFAPVSYTHLDVYKRQGGYSGPGGGGRTGKACGQLPHP